jgi:hypothetical protein
MATPKYASQWDYKDLSYNFDSSDDLQELITQLQDDINNEPDIIQGWVGYAKENGLINLSCADPIWGWSKETEDMYGEPRRF